VKLILSRKGFDSSSGGVPSPIFPDGRMLSLPIPEQDEWAEASYRITYEQLRWPGEPIGDLVEQLTRRSVSREHRAHIDPDIFAGSLTRGTGWRPIFGQSDAAQAHLENQKVGPGDIFLFFGLFREVELKGSFLGFASSSREKHVIFGWLQVDEVVQVVPVAACRARMPWAVYHPHVCSRGYSHNTLYVASEHLSFDGSRPGAGVFHQYCENLRLTAPDQASSSVWLLPAWFAPAGHKSPLTYHRSRERWGTVTKQGVLLRSVGRGQEFVLDCDAYPEAHGWLAELFHDAPPTRPAGSSELSAS